MFLSPGRENPTQESLIAGTSDVGARWRRHARERKQWIAGNCTIGRERQVMRRLPGAFQS
jgi:hypothetical protein